MPMSKFFKNLRDYPMTGIKTTRKTRYVDLLVETEKLVLEIGDLDSLTNKEKVILLF